MSDPVGRRDDARPLRLCYPAEPMELHRIREDVRWWAELNEVPDAVLVDLQLALGEAVANGVEHAYRTGDPGTVDVDLELRISGSRGGVVAVRVADHGQWHQAPLMSGYRGRGLIMINYLAEQVAVSATRFGTEVYFEIPLRA
ncbi:MAG: ATP-binding protein [Pseudonocardia sp.]